MNARPKQNFAPEQMMCGRIDEGCKRYAFGKGTMRRVGEEANAVIRIGKSVFYNFTKIDKYLDSISQ